jgi:molecular chaperone GrpE (heat shock protein)
VLLGLAIWLLKHYPHPLPPWPATLMVGCVFAASLLAVWPYRVEYETFVKLAESDNLTSTVNQIKNLQGVAEQIRLATGQWQGVQEHSAKTVSAAKEVAARMASEAHAFAEFMQKANDSEKSTLRLEVEKLRRGEGQWLQVLVHLLDHVFALYQAGVRSGQANLQEQLGQFQEACRDIARRVGLTPFEATPDSPFEADKHQLADGQPQPPPDARVSQTLATGYTFQGQLLRRSLVALQSTEAIDDTAVPSTDCETQSILPEFSEAESSLVETSQETIHDAERAFRLESEGLTTSGNDSVDRLEP